LKPSFYCLRAMSISPSPDIVLQIQNSEDMRKWISNPVSNFHNDPTVIESGIVVLLGQVLDLYGKGEGYYEKRISITFDIFSQFSTEKMFRNEFLTWCSNFMTIQRVTSLRSSFYWDRFKCMWEKERVLEEGEGKRKLRGRVSAKV